VSGVSEVVRPVELAARAHELNPDFNPKYRQATLIDKAFLEHAIVGLKPAFRYALQINRNIATGNSLA
jgi:hypothetical protein